jgi:prepilin-type N-terminal cleavage/methylation domain-containing protein
MSSRSSPLSGRQRGFSLVEVLVALSIMTVTAALALGTFVFCMTGMYKDAQRMATNATLRYFTAHVAKETIDSSEFHIFPTYQKLDGNIDLTNDVAQQAEADFGTEASYGDCLVLVTRINVDADSNIRQFRIYYRTVSNANTAGAVRYYESTDYGASGTTSSLTTLLNGVNLAANPSIAGSRQIVATARGRPITLSGAHWCPLSTPPYTDANKCTHTTDYYPIFSSESSTATPVNDGVSINAEIINGTTAANQLSSSSFNYTISPRR